jgi:hypothetical protein
MEKSELVMTHADTYKHNTHTHTHTHRFGRNTLKLVSTPLKETGERKSLLLLPSAVT